MSADAVATASVPDAGAAHPNPQRDPDQVHELIPRSTVTRLLRHAVVGPGAEQRITTAPFTGGPATTLPLSTEDDVETAFAMARRAQVAWAGRPARERAKVLLRFHDLVLDRQAEVLDLAQMETGKTRRDAFEELLDCALNARHYARVGPGLLAPEKRLGVFLALTRTVEYHHAKGVVGVISPWNYPITLAVSDALPALLAGNAVVLRPDIQTTVTALAVVDLLREAGLPQGLLPVVIGPGSVTGPWVIDRADYVMFTGSTPVGRGVAARCGERLIGCSLELGGKNALVVRADADIERAAEIAERACFANAGQLCIGIERVYVHEAIAEPFQDAFLRRVRGAADATRGRLGRRDGVAGLRQAAGRGAGPPRRRGRQGRPGADRGPGATGHRAVLRRADGADRRHRRTCSRAGTRRSGRSFRWTPSAPTTRPSRWPTTPSTG